MEIKKLKLTNLHNGEHFTFHTTFRDMVNKLTPAAMKIEALFSPYLKLYAQLDEALKKISKSEQSEKIAELDEARDKVFRGMVDTVKGASNHFKPEIVAAAKRIMIILDTYGNVAAMTLDDETAMLYNLLKELKDKCRIDVELLGLGAWIDELNRLNKELQDAMAARTNETADRTPLVLSKVRVEIDGAYRALVRRIDALQEVSNDEAGTPWAVFIADLNAVIERANKLLAQREGRNARKNEEEDN